MYVCTKGKHCCDQLDWRTTVTIKQQDAQSCWKRHCLTKLFLDGYKKLLSEDVLVPFFIYGCVLKQMWVSSFPCLVWMAPLMNGLRMLYCWLQHRTDDSAHLFFSRKVLFFFIFRFFVFSGYPKQSEKIILPQSSAVQSCNLWSVVLLPFLTPGHPPKLFTSLCSQMHPHLPAAVPGGLFLQLIQLQEKSWDTLTFIWEAISLPAGIFLCFKELWLHVSLHVTIVN